MLSVVVLFYLRYDAALPPYHRMKDKRTCVLFVFCLVQAVTMIITPIHVYFMTPDQAVAKKDFIEVCRLIHYTHSDHQVIRSVDSGNFCAAHSMQDALSNKIKKL